MALCDVLIFFLKQKISLWSAVPQAFDPLFKYTYSSLTYTPNIATFSWIFQCHENLRNDENPMKLR